VSRCRCRPASTWPPTSILQEALTNARRHAPSAAVDVDLRYRAGSLRLRVRDSGPGPSADSEAGLGMLGMRERAAMVGGALRTGVADGGGFVVEADLPTGPGAAVAARPAGGPGSEPVPMAPEGPGT
jgi:signal transduction histidine kinase